MAEGECLQVLILVVMEYTFGVGLILMLTVVKKSLNPCFNGITLGGRQYDCR